ncbi:MAG TPA: hypothetical protein VL443_19955 [Cyclobacteriaceae bacterium]|nr:hypothetical protein [Cyclobacteriaceae bacterium]
MIKKTIKDTDPEVLISHLRAEIGDLIDSWILYRHFKLTGQKLQTDDILADSKNKELYFLYLVTGKFRDDMITRVAELGDKKVGQLTFHFATRKFKALESEVDTFEKFVKDNKFTDRRNNFISHKNLKPTWTENKAPDRISYKTMTKAIAMAIRLMKKFDELHYGIKIRRQWQLIRKSRYEFSVSRKAEYIIMPLIVDTNGV